MRVSMRSLSTLLALKPFAPNATHCFPQNQNCTYILNPSAWVELCHRHPPSYSHPSQSLFWEPYMHPWGRALGSGARPTPLQPLRLSLRTCHKSLTPIPRLVLTPAAESHLSTGTGFWNTSLARRSTQCPRYWKLGASAPPDTNPQSLQHCFCTSLTKTMLESWSMLRFSVKSTLLKAYTPICW